MRPGASAVFAFVVFKHPFFIVGVCSFFSSGTSFWRGSWGTFSHCPIIRDLGIVSQSRVLVDLVRIRRKSAKWLGGYVKCSKVNLRSTSVSGESCVSSTSEKYEGNNSTQNDN
jgi:hypothetical protein